MLLSQKKPQNSKFILVRYHHNKRENVLILINNLYSSVDS